MAHRFEITQDVDVDATPEQVWDAIATGRGLDSWFMGRNDVEPREGGAVHWSIGGYTAVSTVTTWDPPHHFVSTGSEAPDGSMHAFDYRVEDRGGGRSTVRYTHSGMLGGDWEAEYEAMSEGDPMYLHKLVQYLTYFQGRYGVPINVQGPNMPDRELAQAGFRRGLGLPDAVTVGDRVTLRPEGFEPVEAVVDHISPHFLGVRSDDALYRFIHGFEGSLFIGHHLYADGVDQATAEDAWRAWLERTFDASAPS